MTAPLLIPLTRELLTRVLNDLSDRLYYSFQQQVRLVVHGDAVMVLHPSLNHRENTQAIHYIHRSFVSEYHALGFPDAEQRLRKCIAETALKYNLGADWMNDHADVALPWAVECVLTPSFSLTRFLNEPTMDYVWSLPFPSFIPYIYSQQGHTYDPVFHAATPPQTAAAQTVFNARGLALVAV